jgi:hypothetical protein
MRAVSDPFGAHSLRPAELQTLVRALGDGDPLLVYRDDAEALQVCRLEAGSRLTIGRRRESDLALSWDAQVSKVHAEIYELAREWVVEDDGLSSYGTFVNGTRVQARHRLRDQDRLRLGQTTLVFRHEPAGEAAQELQGTIGPADELPQLSPMRKRVLVELCRPMLLQAEAKPATNPDIADAVHLSPYAIKDHLGELARMFGHTGLGRGEQRAAIAETAIRRGIVSIRDLA